MKNSTIITFDASEAKNKFGAVLEMAQRQPVAIRRHGRKVAFIVSKADMEALEDFYLGSRAVEIMRRSKSLGVKKSEAYLRKILNAKN